MHTIQKVKPLNNYKLEITFNTNEVFIFNIKPYLNKPVFQVLNNKKKFQSVSLNPETQTIAWGDDIDFCSESLYIKYLKEKE
jgi:hypothetical protein